MAVTLTIIDAVVARLKAAFPDLAVEYFPDKPAEYRLNHPKGALLVSYLGAKYDEPIDTSAIVQPAVVKFAITATLRQLNGPDLPPEAALRLEISQTELAAVLGASRPKVNLAAVMSDLARRGVNELHLEAGHKLNASVLQAGLVDELLVYLAPILMGPGAGMAALGPFTAMNQALRWQFAEVAQVGPDLRIRARRMETAQPAPGI